MWEGGYDLKTSKWEVMGRKDTETRRVKCWEWSSGSK